MLQKRDLIILSKSSETSIEAFEKEVHSINRVLYTVESMQMFCIVNEIIDINRYKIIDTPFLIQKIVADKMRPFVFVYNKN